MKYFLILSLLTARIAFGQATTPSPTHNQKTLVQNFLFQPTPAFSPLKSTPDKFDLSEQPEKKNVTTAVLYSLLLPGMGELYVGNYSSGKYFTIVEGALWITMGAYDWYATSLQDDARRFAIQHAQANINGKDDQYFVDIGEFRNIYDYNTQILRNREPEKLYNPTTSYWSWDSDANRSHFDDLRVASDERFNDLRFVAAAIAVNHVVSAVNAARMAIVHNHNLSESGQLDIHASVIGGLAHPNGILISLSKKF